MRIAKLRVVGLSIFDYPQVSVSEAAYSHKLIRRLQARAIGLSIIDYPQVFPLIKISKVRYQKQFIYTSSYERFKQV